MDRGLLAIVDNAVCGLHGLGKYGRLAAPTSVVFKKISDRDRLRSYRLVEGNLLQRFVACIQCGVP